MDTTEAIYRRNYELRYALLRQAGLVESGADFCAASGWSKQYLSKFKNKTNPALADVSRLALLVALPVEVLLSPDAAAVSEYPMPSFDWLGEIARRRDELGYQIADGEKRRTSDVVGWLGFCDAAAPSHEHGLT